MWTRMTLIVGLGIAVMALAACGGDDGGDSDVVSAPDDLDEPASGTLRVFAYSDTVYDEILDPFREANPDVDLKVATFNSNKAAAAKLAGGFEADVVELCADEMEPLTARGLVRPIDPSGIGEFGKLAFSDAEEVRDENGDVLFVPASAGPHGLVVNTDEVPEGVDSWEAMFDPEYAGNVAMASSALTAIGVTGLALGVDDPMNMSVEEIEEAKEHLLANRDNFRDFPESDSAMINLFKSGEVVLANGGRGDTQVLIDDGAPVEWVAPEEGALSWVCGLAITSDAENVDAAYKLLRYYASPEAQAASARFGFVAMNPDALADVPQKFQETADPRNLETAIPETQPDNIEAYERAWQEVVAG